MADLALRLELRTPAASRLAPLVSRCADLGGVLSVGLLGGLYRAADVSAFERALRRYAVACHG